MSGADEARAAKGLTDQEAAHMEEGVSRLEAETAALEATNPPIQPEMAATFKA